MDRHGRISIVNVIIFLGLIAAGVIAYTFTPYYWDHMKMDEVTKSAVLEWDAYDNKQRAQDKLSELLDKREIGDYILPEDCEFLEDPPQVYTVHCAWQVDAHYPFTQKFKTLTFETLETVDEKGLVH